MNMRTIMLVKEEENNDSGDYDNNDDRDNYDIDDNHYQ